jgi:hypothetical protein
MSPALAPNTSFSPLTNHGGSSCIATWIDGGASLIWGL